MLLYFIADITLVLLLVTNLAINNFEDYSIGKLIKLVSLNLYNRN